MKKLLLLGCIFVISIFSTSCNYNQTQNKVIITRNDTAENEISGMGIDYEIKNVQSTNIDENFKYKSTGEIIIYLKISDTK